MTGKEDKPAVTHVTEEITPEIAARYLERNNLNRPIRTRRVGELSADMTAGRWKENGEAGVTFDWNGNIAGGQHTLLAVIDSGITIRCRVTRGVEPEARSTMNDSSKQRVSDDLATAGVANAQRAEALLRKALTWDRVAARSGGLGGLGQWRRARYSRSELLDVWQAYKEGIEQSLAVAGTWHDSWPATGGNYGALEFMVWLLLVRAGCNETTVREFVNRLVLGSQDPDDRILLRVRLKFKRPPNSADYQVYWMIRGWNAWTRGERLAHLQLPAGSDKALPDPFPKLQRAR